MRKTPFSLENRTILITGGSSGIGRACAIAASEMGARVAVLGRNEERLNETVDLLTGNGHSSYSCDITDSPVLKKTFQSVVTEMGRLDGMVCCAGMMELLPLRMIQPDDVLNMMQVNVASVIDCVKYFSSKKVAQPEGGSIVLLSSVVANVGQMAQTVYASTKAALLGASKSMATELSSKKIRVNVLQPWVIEKTGMSENWKKTSVSTDSDDLAGKPFGVGEASDVANASIFLLSNASRWITGTSIVIDGGYSLNR